MPSRGLLGPAARPSQLLQLWFTILPALTRSVVSSRFRCLYVAPCVCGMSPPRGREYASAWAVETGKAISVLGSIMSRDVPARKRQNSRIRIQFPRSKSFLSLPSRGWRMRKGRGAGGTHQPPWPQGQTKGRLICVSLVTNSQQWQPPEALLIILSSNSR